jgi:hypothetical protein
VVLERILAVEWLHLAIMRMSNKCSSSKSMSSSR